MIPGHTQRARVARRGTLMHMADTPTPPREPTASESLEEWRQAERSATAAERAADAAERASEAAERAAVAAERVDRDEPEKTDMNAVGDDGQVFGG
jgi:hypothetical protein